ncbi:MAG: MarR family winged helix-turn-helix transcriptional regulator [Candidatus Dormibacteria bacterium]
MTLSINNALPVDALRKVVNRPGGASTSVEAEQVLELEQLGDMLASIMSGVLQERLMAEMGLDVTPAQASVLRDLLLHENRTMAQVAVALRLTRPAATRLVDRLERKGLVARSEDQDDRRCIGVRLTHRGRELSEAISARRRDRLAAVLGSLPPMNREQLLLRLREFVALTIVQPDLVEELCRYCGTEHNEQCVVNEAHLRFNPGKPRLT